jgi:hypothetical protein
LSHVIVDGTLQREDDPRIGGRWRKTSHVKYV